MLILLLQLSNKHWLMDTQIKPTIVSIQCEPQSAVIDHMSVGTLSDTHHAKAEQIRSRTHQVCALNAWNCKEKKWILHFMVSNHWSGTGLALQRFEKGRTEGNRLIPQLERAGQVHMLQLHFPCFWPLSLRPGNLFREISKCKVRLVKNVLHYKSAKKERWLSFTGKEDSGLII